jgi:hypothetical protein
MNKVLNLSRNTGHIKLTGLDLWQPTFPQLCRAFYEPKIDHDKLNAGWYLRGTGLFDGITAPKRGNDTVSNTASLLILDGDSRIDVNGNIVAGAANPQHVHLVLNFLNIDHFIYTSHSNDVGLNKYRVLIPVEYTREQLPALLEWIFARLHENDVMLTNVKENSTWAQAWFMPCVPAERAHLFKTWWRVGGKALDKTDVSEWFEPAEPFDVERIYSEWLAKQAQQSTVKKVVAPIERPKLATGGATNTTDPIAAFNQAYSVHDILIRNGYKQQGNRYLHPNSSSGIAGARILESGLVYSDASDYLNDGKAHDAFDTFRLLECSGDYRTACNWDADLVKANQIAYMKAKEEALPKMDFSNLKVNGRPVNTPQMKKAQQNESIVPPHNLLNLTPNEPTPIGSNANS